MAGPRKSTVQYAALLVAAFLLALSASWFLGGQIDRSAYDFLLSFHKPKPWKTESVILAIDEKTLRSCGGLPGLRKPLAEGLRLTAPARAVVVDILLADMPDPAVGRTLADAFRIAPNLVLSSQLTGDGWEDPRPEFARWAAAVGHVHAEPDQDNVTRSIPLEKRSGRVRRWAIALEAFRLSRGGPTIVEHDNKLEIGSVAVPIGGAAGRLMRLVFVPPGMTPIPRISLADLVANPALSSQFAGKIVFAGVTALSAQDRLSTPYSFATQTTGIEIHANAFETLAQGVFLTDVADIWVVLICIAIAIAVGAAFRYLPGWLAYAGGGAALLLAHLTPYFFFTAHRVFPFAPPFFTAWLTFLSAAAFYHLVVRRNWRAEQAARTRYQQAMHFVTHEMRTPLSAIQGSSELISRYALTEEKRKQIALLINSESKRLARMVEIFLNVERLSAGQMELKRESIPVKEMVEACVARVVPLAERKHIVITLQPIAEDLRITGDRELMEYACYNLLTNAVKYSPQGTEVIASAGAHGGHARIAVKDQGIGMDRKEVTKIFQKFYRTKTAEQSGEMGTGIGLSIVQQIVEQHGGRIEVTSQPGEGSCFTLALPAQAPAAAERN